MNLLEAFNPGITKGEEDYLNKLATATTTKKFIQNPTQRAAYGQAIQQPIMYSQSSKGLLQDNALTQKLKLPEPTTEARKMTDRNMTGEGAKVEGATQLPFNGNTQQGIKDAVDETLPPPEIVQQEVVETEEEIKQAAEDPSMWKQFTEKLGVSGDDAWKGAKDAAGRVDWLTMAVVAAASASTGSNATKAIANGLLRGMESKTAQKQQAAANQAAQQKNLLGAQEAADKSKLGWYKAETDRGRADAYGRSVDSSGEDVGVPELSANERAVVGNMPDDFTPDVWNQAAMELKKRGKAIDPVSMKNVAKQMQEKGYVSDKWFGKDSLV